MFKLKAVHRDLKLANVFLHFPDMVGKEAQITPDWLKSVNME
jgi:hypothetical protein